MTNDIHAIYPEQLVLFADNEDTAAFDRKDCRSEKHTSHRPSSRKGGLRPLGGLHNPFDGFDANQYHTVGADAETNAEIGYEMYDNEVIMADRFHNYYGDVDYAIPDECDSTSERLPDYISWELLNAQKYESNATEIGKVHWTLQKYTNARINPKDTDVTSCHK